MKLHRLHLNPRHRGVRRDLADPYQMHASLCRAFCSPEGKCPPNTFLWRLETDFAPDKPPRLLVQSHLDPNWTPMLESGWLTYADPGIDLTERLALDAGKRFRFRLRANPCKTVQGKRQGLMDYAEQMAWLQRKGEQHGFALAESRPEDYFDMLLEKPNLACRITQTHMLKGRQHGGNVIHIYAVLYEGLLDVVDPGLFRQALAQGIGHGKMMGLGLLSVVPVRA